MNLHPIRVWLFQPLLALLLGALAASNLYAQKEREGYLTGGSTPLEPRMQEKLDTNADLIRLGINVDNLQQAGIDPENFVMAILEMVDVVKQGYLPGGVVYMDTMRGDNMPIGVGMMMLEPEQHETDWSTFYELGSATAAITTTPFALYAIQQGKIALDDSLGDYLPRLEGTPHASLTIEQLMRHQTGLPADSSIPRNIRKRDQLLDYIKNLELVHAPGDQITHSEFNLIYLGLVLEEVFGMPIQEFAINQFFKPFGMLNTVSDLPDHFRDRCAPGPVSEWHGRMTWGEASSPAAYILGESAASGGLLTTADDMGIFARAMIITANVGIQDFISSETLHMSLQPTDDSPEGRTQGLGWALNGFGEGSFGWHCGTGCSIWINPEKEAFSVVLSNVFHPRRSRENAAHDCRIRLYDDLYNALPVSGSAQGSNAQLRKNPTRAIPAPGQSFKW